MVSSLSKSTSVRFIIKGCRRGCVLVTKEKKRMGSLFTWYQVYLLIHYSNINMLSDNTVLIPYHSKLIQVSIEPPVSLHCHIHQVSIVTLSNALFVHYSIISHYWIIYFPFYCLSIVPLYHPLYHLLHHSLYCPLSNPLTHLYTIHCPI